MHLENSLALDAESQVMSFLVRASSMKSVKPCLTAGRTTDCPSKSAPQTSGSRGAKRGRRSATRGISTRGAKGGRGRKKSNSGIGAADDFD